jgi:hypothetical protein
MDVFPENVFEPESVSVPLPLLRIPPVPEMLPEIVERLGRSVNVPLPTVVNV